MQNVIKNYEIQKDILNLKQVQINLKLFINKLPEWRVYKRDCWTVGCKVGGRQLFAKEKIAARPKCADSVAAWPREPEGFVCFERFRSCTVATAATGARTLVRHGHAIVHANLATTEQNNQPNNYWTAKKKNDIREKKTKVNLRPVLSNFSARPYCVQNTWCSARDKDRETGGGEAQGGRGKGGTGTRDTTRLYFRATGNPHLQQDHVAQHAGASLETRPGSFCIQRLNFCILYLSLSAHPLQPRPRARTQDDHRWSTRPKSSMMIDSLQQVAIIDEVPTSNSIQRTFRLFRVGSSSSLDSVLFLRPIPILAMMILVVNFFFDFIIGFTLLL